MEKFRIGRVTAHKRTEGSNWSLYWRIGGKRYRRTTQAVMRHAAEKNSHRALDTFEANSPLRFKSLINDQLPSLALAQTTLGYYRLGVPDVDSQHVHQ